MIKAVMIMKDVVNGVVHKVRQTCYSHKSERLYTKQRKHDCRQSRRQNNFVYAIAVVCALIHVQNISQCRHEIDEEDANDTRTHCEKILGS